MLYTGFISATENYSDFESLVPAPFLRKSFYLKAAPETAVAEICALGFYRLFINGKEHTRGALSPYITNPDEYLFYDSYELSDTLHEGENVIGFILGNGMQNAMGGNTWDFDKAPWRSAPMLSFRLSADCGNEHLEVCSDTDVKTHPSPILLDDLRIGEYYDARLEALTDGLGWTFPGFDDSGWKSAIKVKSPRACAHNIYENRLRLSDIPPVIISERRKPVSVIPSEIDTEYGIHEKAKGKFFPRNERMLTGYLFDFGLNTAGSVSLHIAGEKGQRLILLFGEATDVNGRLILRNTSFIPFGQQQRLEYTCKGGGAEEYVPSFTYFGYRYCFVSGITPEQARPELLEMLVMHTALNRTGDFHCSDDVASRLYQMALNSDLSNFVHFPTDCPHREKNGWTGDAALSAEQFMMSFDAGKSLSQWMCLIRSSMDNRGALPGIVPTGGWGFEWGNGPAWDAVLFSVPFYVWKYSGDMSIIRDNAHAMLCYLDYILSRRDERGLIAVGLGDWCPAAHINQTFKAPLVFTDTVTVMDIAEKARIMFGAAGLVPQSRFASDAFDDLKAAARKYLVDIHTYTAVGNCQTTQAMAVAYGVFDDAEKPEAVRRLVDMINKNGSHFDTGILGARVLFRVLADHGFEELAYKLIVDPEFPSYGSLALKGDTSLREDFRAESVPVNSLNHHFFGDISAWLISYPGGIRVNPSLSSPDEVDIKPCFISTLDNVYARRELPCGTVEVEWTRTARCIKLKITAPAKARGFIRLPYGYKFDDSTSFAELRSGEFKVITAEQNTVDKSSDFYTG